MSEYNGYKNYQTWNIALWVGNDECLYHEAKRFKNYTSFREYITSFESKTPDGVKYFDDRLDIEVLDRLIKEIK